VKEYIIAGMIASHSLQSNAIPWLELIGFESLSVFGLPFGCPCHGEWHLHSFDRACYLLLFCNNFFPPNSITAAVHSSMQEDIPSYSCKDVSGTKG